MMTVELGLVCTAVFTMGNGLQLARNQLFAKRRNLIRVQLALQMAELVLHDTCSKAVHPFIFLFKILIHIFNMDPLRAYHVLMQSGDAETSFAH